MTLGIVEFIRRFLTHVLPKSFHRIRHYGLLASSNRTETMEAVRKLLNLTPPAAEQMSDNRSGAAVRAPLPLLRRPHDHYRDFRGRLPATPPTNHASRGNQDRYLMSVDTSHTITRFLCWSSTGNAAARPMPAQHLHFGSCASPKHSVSAAHSNPISRSSTHNHNILAPLTASGTRHAKVKSP